VIKEEGDEALENEEPTARCNAINIIPADNGETDVQIINEEDDVVMVSEPPTPKKKQIPFLKWIIFTAILCLVILVAACFVLLGDDKKEKKQSSMPAVMQNPITRKATDTIKTNTTDTLNHDSAGNQ
jgi:hypothetical protein